jgi:hypothetical protein
MLRKRATRRSILSICGMLILYPVMGERMEKPAIPDVLTVVVLPAGPFAPPAIDEMTREVARVMKTTGLKFKWSIGVDRQVFDEPLAIVKLPGTCSMDPLGAAGKPGPLGWTHSSDGGLLPFSELACDNIRRAIQAEMRNDDQLRGNGLLGRAMGRVLAHELFHVIAATKKHTNSGVSQPALTAAELIADRLEFDSAGAELIQDRLHASH